MQLVEDITVEQLKHKLDRNEDILVIDVRQPEEYDEFNIGARLIPLASLPSALKELESERNKEIVVHCRSGARSEQAKHYMLANGFLSVRNLLGGMLEWKKKFSD